MLKKYMYCIFFMLAYVCKSQSVQIIDSDDILDVKNIEYRTEEELNQKLEEILNKINTVGYIGTNFVEENGNLKIVPKRINSVKYIDNSTKNIELKKFLSNMNLENKLFNIREIERIVANFNKLKSNKLKVDVYNRNDGEVDLVFTNEYTPNLDISWMYVSSYTKPEAERINLNLISATKDQIFGLNDKFRINLMFEEDYLNVDTRYGLNIKNGELEAKYKYVYVRNNEDIRDFYDTVGIRYKRSKVIPKGMLDIETSFNDTKKRQYIRDIKIADLEYRELDLNVDFRKRLGSNIVGFSQNLGGNFVYIDKFDDVILKFDNNTYINNRYFTSELDTKYSKSIVNEKMEIDRYTFSNGLGVDAYPIVMKKSYWQIMWNNKIKYPIVKNNNILQPFFEMAGGISERTKYNVGGSLGLEYIFKNFGFKIKYSFDKFKNRNLGLRFNVNLGRE